MYIYTHIIYVLSRSVKSKTKAFFIAKAGCDWKIAAYQFRFINNICL